MCLLRSLAGSLSLIVCAALIAGIVASFFPSIDFENGNKPLITILGLVILLVPYAVLGYFSDRKVPSSNVGFAVFLFVTCFIVGVAFNLTLQANLDFEAFRIRDRVGLMTFVSSILESRTGILVVYFSRALSMVILGLSLKPVAELDPKIRPLRVFLLLAGLSSASLIASPLFIVFFTLAYGSLGKFLITTRIGLEPRPVLVFIDDYDPA